MGNKIKGSALRSLTASKPRLMRISITLLELGLVLLLAYQLASLMFDAVEAPTRPDHASFEVQTEAAKAPDLAILSTFDPFFRQIAKVSEVPQGNVAPETTLRIEVFGLRSVGDGQGTAILKMQDSEQKLVQVGEEIANGVKLAGVFADRLEIIRAGVREAVFLRPQADRVATQRVITSSKSPAADGFKGETVFSELQLTPVRRNRRIIGFRLPQILPPTLQLVGLEAEDILLSVNGSPLTSHERLEEMVEEVAGAHELSLEYERRGEQRRTVLRLKGTN